MNKQQPLFIDFLNAKIHDEESCRRFWHDSLIPWLCQDLNNPLPTRLLKILQAVGERGGQSSFDYSCTDLQQSMDEEGYPALYDEETGGKVHRVQEAVVSVVQIIREGNTFEDPAADLLGRDVKELNDIAKPLRTSYGLLPEPLRLLSVESPRLCLWAYPVPIEWRPGDVVAYPAMDFLQYVTREDPTARWVLQCDWRECGRWFRPGKKREKYGESNKHFCGRKCRDNAYNARTLDSKKETAQSIRGDPRHPKHSLYWGLKA